MHVKDLWERLPFSAKIKLFVSGDSCTPAKNVLMNITTSVLARDLTIVLEVGSSNTH